MSDEAGDSPSLLGDRTADDGNTRKAAGSWAGTTLFHIRLACAPPHGMCLAWPSVRKRKDIWEVGLEWIKKSTTKPELS
jgi:hypothetical protein